jgi:hypothetical protein
MEILNILDLVLPPFVLIFVLIYCNIVKNRYSKKLEEYQYIQTALLVKIMGAIVFAMIYLFYYGGGDTINYFKSGLAIRNLMIKNFGEYIEFSNTHFDASNRGRFFDQQTGYTIFDLTDGPAIFTSKFYAPIIFLTGGSFITTTMISAIIGFTGLWKLYQVFISEFPQIKRQLYIAIFLVPSVFFWGSGIMKDTITLGAVGWYVYSLHSFFILRKRKLKYLLFLFISCYLIISIKPYILFALLPGSIIWLSNQYAGGIQNKIVRRVFTPILLTLGCLGAYFALNQVDEMLGFYKLDTVAERASTVNKDLQKDYYGGKSFNVGEYEPTIAGMASVAHRAIFAALFRPTLLDTQNIVMVFSAIENSYLLFLTIVLLIRLKFFGFFRFIFGNPLLLFSILFALFFAFSVGISISNFGSLVRLRIPALPFFVSSLFIIKHLYEVKYKTKLKV